ncbi:FAD-binding protein [Leisingera sp. ANG-S5]|uniref:FAD-binding protein n=1 Tax=Leisingera sp. ANG-S5 TaxID=1577901 RepID=UPI0009E41BBF|nr:FAD-binding protein [Leisingera sp. ANG-S5]
MNMMTPGSEAELAEAIAGASGPLCIQGGGSRGLGVEGDVLSTRGLSGIELYEPGALTLVVKSGTPVAEVEALLAAENQRLAFEPMDHRGLLGTDGEPTVGGVIAANVSGPRRIQAGAARDHLLGVRLVDGSGQAVKNGGRVMKNVTGYDLVKLMCGAHGTLGVLTEVSLKVLPKPECSGTLVWHGLGWVASLKVFCEALKSPYDVTGAGRVPQGAAGKSMTYIRVEGFEDSVKYRLTELRRLFSDLKPDELNIDAEENAQIWQSLRDAEPFHGKAGDVWRTSVKPTDMLKVTGQRDFEHVVDWGGGLIWSLVPEGEDLRQKLANVPGHATLVRASADTRARIGVFQPQPAPLAAISEGLRWQFDPRGILNPGLMG